MPRRYNPHDPMMRRFSFHVPASIDRALQLDAANNGSTVAACLIDALRAHYGCPDPTPADFNPQAVSHQDAERLSVEGEELRRTIEEAIARDVAQARAQRSLREQQRMRRGPAPKKPVIPDW